MTKLVSGLLAVSMGGWVLTPAHAQGLPQGALTTSGAVSGKGGVDGFGDLLVPLVQPPGSVLFLDVRGYADDSGLEQSSVGLGYRATFDQLGGYPIILGGNVLWDYADSYRGYGYDGLGVGFEALSEWVDARFNYYWPESTQNRYDRQVETTVDRDVSSRTRTVGSKVIPGPAGGSPTRVTTLQTTRTTRTTTTRRTTDFFESALEGWNAEIGGRIPGVPETRLFVGYESYDNPFGGGNFDGWNSRLESYLARGVILDVSWSEVSAIRPDNHEWLFGARVQVPLEFRGGQFGENLRSAFTRTARSLEDRKTDPIIRYPMRFAEAQKVRTEIIRDVDTSTSNRIVTQTLPSRGGDEDEDEDDDGDDDDDDGGNNGTANNGGNDGDDDDDDGGNGNGTANNGNNNGDDDDDDGGNGNNGQGNNNGNNGQGNNNGNNGQGNNNGNNGQGNNNGNNGQGNNNGNNGQGNNNGNGNN